MDTFFHDRFFQVTNATVIWSYFLEFSYSLTYFLQNLKIPSIVRGMTPQNIYLLWYLPTKVNTLAQKKEGRIKQNIKSGIMHE